MRKKAYLPRGIYIIFWLVMFIKTKRKKNAYKEQKPQRKKEKRRKKKKRKKSIN